MSAPTFVSLFSGIGGLDLGLERAGWRCVGQVEIDPFCRRVLARHWPDVPRWGDIREVSSDDLPRADLVAGGFPCQPVSVAGARRGQADERWLWPEFARVVCHLRPSWVLVENVPGLLVRGMGDVLGDLAESGYDAEWDCIPAAAVGAPHLRDRVWLVAYPSGSQLWLEPGRRDGQGRPGAAVAGDDGQTRHVAHPEGFGGELRPPSGQRPRRSAGGSDDLANPDGRPALWAPVARGQRHPWATEPDVGRVAHGVPARLDRLRALGNAVVPQVAELIGRRILEAAA
jgi:DNA (cytosine-5)-methyltransferase 1